MQHLPPKSNKVSIKRYVIYNPAGKSNFAGTDEFATADRVFNFLYFKSTIKESERFTSKLCIFTLLKINNNFELNNKLWHAVFQ